MKKNWKSVLAGGAAVTVLAGVLAIPALAYAGSRTARLDYQNMKVTLDGPTLTLTDGSGNTVEPFTIDGTTYLPLAAIGRALGLDVAWDSSTNTVVLTSGGSTAGQTPDQSGDYIGADKAKAIALDHAGLTESSVTFVRAELDYDNGRMEYEVEFWKDNVEYDYEIDASTGEIRSWDHDIEGYSIGNAQSSSDIGAEQAKTIALNHAGVSASDAVFLYAKLDRDDGRRVYEVEFYSGSREYDYEIDAATGDVVSYDFDAERYTGQQEQSGSYISEARVKEIVEDRAGTTGTYREFKLERDDGRTVYEGELRSGWTEYEFTVDAYTGEILEWSVDR